MPHAEMAEVVKQLLDSQMVVRESAEALAFSHALTRDAAYATVLVRERKRLHRIIAETIEHETGEAHGTLGGRLGELAYHYYEADAWEQTLNYAELAGTWAQSVNAPREAVTYFSWALDAASRLPLPPPTHLLHVRGKAYEAIGDFERALADYEQALANARSGDDPAAEWQALLDLGFLWAGRDYQRTGEFFRRAALTACDLADPDYRAHSQNWLGNWLANTGQAAESLQAHREALEIFQSRDQRVGMAETLDLLGFAYSMYGDGFLAVDAQDQAIALFREQGDLQSLCGALAMRCAISCPALSDTITLKPTAPGECERFGLEAIRLAQQTGAPAAMAFAHMCCIQAYGAHGVFGEALAHAREARRLAAEIGHQQWICATHWALGYACYWMLDAGAAVQEFEAGLTIAQALSSNWWTGLHAAYLALAHIARREWARAEALLHALFTPRQPPRNISDRRLAWVRGELALARGDAAAALQMAEQLLASAPRTDATRDQPIPVLLKLKGEALAALGQSAEAERALSDAKRGAQERGARPQLWPIHCSLGRLQRQHGHADEAAREFAAARDVIAALAETLETGAPRERFVRAALAFIPQD